MQFLEADRAVCDKLLPGLRQQLAELPLAGAGDRGQPGDRDVPRARRHEPAWCRKSYGGLDAPRCGRCQGDARARPAAPSMTVATMMHHFSLGTLFAVAELLGGGSDLERTCC